MAPKYLVDLLPPRHAAFANLRSRLPIYSLEVGTERYLLFTSVNINFCMVLLIPFAYVDQIISKTLSITFCNALVSQTKDSYSLITFKVLP